jgi:hypothetical protein
LAADLSQPIDLLLQRKIDPIKVMQRYRQAVELGVHSDMASSLHERESNIGRNKIESNTTKYSNQTQSLRKQSTQSNIEGSADDLDPDAANELILELRERDLNLAKPSNMKIDASYSSTELASGGINKQSCLRNQPDKSQSPSNSLPGASESDVVSGNFCEIETLRARDAGLLIDEKAEEYALEDDLQHIRMLRNAGKKQTKRNRPISGGKTRETQTDDQCKEGAKTRKQQRLSIRIEAATLEKLQRHTENSGLNISKIIRDAIDRYLDGFNNQR